MKQQRDVLVREVGMRDGLQGIETFFPTEGKRAWVRAEADAGVPEIEVCSFVPPKISGQFVDCEAVVAEAKQCPELLVSALIPNEKGAERGFALGVPKLNFVLSASESHNLRNVRCTSDESLERFARIASLRDAHAAQGPRAALSGGISTAFGCTIEGRIAPEKVLQLATHYLELGADEISVADTVGYANPGQVTAMFRMLRRELGPQVVLAAHFHDTRGLGLSNVCGALEADVRIFDASLAGLGGCPFAPGATGNIVMDDLVFMLESMGLKTGVDLERLLAVREIVAANLPEEPLHGAIARAGLPKDFTPASMAQAAE